VDALVQESSDAVLGLTGAVATVTDFNLKQILESTKRALNYLSGKLKAAVPKEAPPPPPEPVAAPEPVKAPVEAPRPADLPAPVAAQSIAAQEQAQGTRKGLLLIGGLVLLAGLAVHGVRYMQERSELEARKAKEAKLPTEFSSGAVTHITLRNPSPEKVAELEARAAAEGKKLLKLSPTEYQLVQEAGGPAPTPPAPDEKKPDEAAADAGTEPEGAQPEGAAPAPKEGEGATP
jgi:hypothetical protein